MFCLNQRELYLYHQTKCFKSQQQKNPLNVTTFALLFTCLISVVQNDCLPQKQSQNQPPTIMSLNYSTNLLREIPSSSMFHVFMTRNCHPGLHIPDDDIKIVPLTEHDIVDTQSLNVLQPHLIKWLNNVQHVKVDIHILTMFNLQTLYMTT